MTEADAYDVALAAMSPDDALAVQFGIRAHPAGTRLTEPEWTQVVDDCRAMRRKIDDWRAAVVGAGNEISARHVAMVNDFVEGLDALTDTALETLAEREVARLEADYLEIENQ